MLITRGIADECSIIEPLASRCSKFRFRPLAMGSSEERIDMIAKAEGVQVDEGVSVPDNVV